MYNLNGSFDQGQQINRTHFKVELAADNPRYIHQVFDQLGLNLCVAFDGLDRVLRRFLVQPVTAQYRQPTQHRRERRPQFMRERSQKLILKLVGSLGLGAGRQFARQQPPAFFLNSLSLRDVVEVKIHIIRVRHRREIDQVGLFADGYFKMAAAAARQGDARYL